MVSADVVKPALVEVNVMTNGMLNVEVRASIEALLTGINSKYKNTKDAPMAKEYDTLRKMSVADLNKAFEPFKQKFLSQIFLKAGKEKIKLTITSVKIPPRGYTKVPRISHITLSGKIKTSVESLQWYYPESFGDNAVRLQQIDKKNAKWHWSQWQWLRNDATSEPFSLTEIVSKKPISAVVFSYTSIGFLHILPKGVDHILFILGLFLLSLHWRALLAQVTMFTIAHTLTLALSMNKIINLPANVVEPLIALSIIYVGVENIFANKLKRSRLLIVFIFGLIHGLGFASVLADFTMAENDFITTLISFNVGVELGQIAVIILAFLLLRIWFKKPETYHKIIVIPGSALISLVATYWFFERLELF